MRLFVLIVGIAAGAAHAQPGPQAPAAPTITVAERAAFYERIAGMDSTAELAELARETASSPERWRMETIVERLFELEPAAAVQVAGELRRAGGPDFVAQIYERLARTDTNAALAALSQIDDPLEAGVAALATFRGLGGDERAFELVTASLQGAALARFRGDALAGLASQAPRTAFAEALALADREARRAAATMVVRRWVMDAPGDAIAAVDSVQDPELKSTLRAMVLLSWQDPETLAAYLATLDTAARSTAFASGVLERLMQAAPALAAELVEDLPPGEERRRILMQIGMRYAQSDPDAALAWARNLGTEDPNLVVSVLRGVAQRDPLRAFELAGSLEEPMRSQAYFAAVSGPIADERQFSTLASRVAAMPDGQTKTAVFDSLIGSWAARPGNAEPALQWMLANAAALPPESFERVAYLYAQANPAAAAAYVDRVPNAARSGWVSSVTVALAATDQQGALAFLERFRGDPAFDRAAVALSQQLAASDPPRAARLLASVPSRGAYGVGPEVTIARHWSERDPLAAANWVLDLPPPTRSLAMVFVTNAWGARDPAAVRDWALAQPAGEKRDVALAAAVRVRGAAPPDDALLRAFSDDRARQSAMMGAVLATAQTDPAAARRLIDAHITDPRLRANAEQMVDGIARGGVPMPAGGIGFPPGVPPGIRSPITGAMPPGVVVGPNGQTIIMPPPAQSQMPLPAGAPPLGIRGVSPPAGDRQ